MGEAFLLVWKFHEEDIKISQNKVYSLRNTPMVHNRCDTAVFSFLRILAKIHKLDKLLKYSSDKDIIE